MIKSINNFTPKRRALVVNKWIRQEMGVVKETMPLELFIFLRNEKNANFWDSLIEKIYGKKLASIDLSDDRFCFRETNRDNIIQAVKIGKYSRPD